MRSVLSNCFFPFELFVLLKKNRKNVNGILRLQIRLGLNKSTLHWGYKDSVFFELLKAIIIIIKDRCLKSDLLHDMMITTRCLKWYQKKRTKYQSQCQWLPLIHQSSSSQANQAAATRDIFQYKIRSHVFQDLNRCDSCVCVLLGFIKPIFGNFYLLSLFFSNHYHPRSEIAEVQPHPVPLRRDLKLQYLIVTTRYFK